MNWTRISRLALLGAIVMSLWILWPALECSGSEADRTPVGGLTEDSEFHDWFYGRDDHVAGPYDEPATARNFFSRFFGRIGGCYGSHPIGAQKPWKLATAGALFGAWLVFGWVGRASWRRRIKRSMRADS